jgi:iron complex transport system ATP-binding protein
MALIEIENLTFHYKRPLILHDVSFEIEAGTFTAITGPNGSGKSTLLNIIGGKLKPTDGKVIVNGKQVSSYSVNDLAKQVASVRQEFVPAFGFTVFETVLMARTIYFGKIGFESERDVEIVNAALADTDTLQFADRRLDQISGGERQRVFIARALAQNTPILLLDEPTSFLDMKHQVGIYDLLKRMQKESKKTIVIVSHDINIAGQYCDKAVLLSTNNQYHIGSADKVFSEEILSKTFDIEIKTGIIGGKCFVAPKSKHEPEKKPEYHI